MSLVRSLNSAGIHASLCTSRPQGGFLLNVTLQRQAPENHAPGTVNMAEHFAKIAKEDTEIREEFGITQITIHQQNSHFRLQANSESGMALWHFGWGGWTGYETK